jgi:hypothetical protein
MMLSDKEEKHVDKEQQLLGFSFRWIIVIGVALLSVVFIWTAAQGSLFDLNTRAIRHSIGYIDSHNSQARALIVDYTTTSDSAHHAATLSDICTLTNDLAPDEVGRDIIAFLKQHPCEGGKR